MEKITVKNTIEQPVITVWKLWIEPGHIINWNTPCPEWHTPRSENDLREGGRFLSRMEARDGSMGFDFSGTYNKVVDHEHIAYTLDDGRKVEVTFDGENGATNLTVTFDPETTNTIEMQRSGWQAILDTFKAYADKS